MHCEPSKVESIDADYAKLAARGVSIVFASGDSGSGYNQEPPHCPMHPGTEGLLYAGATPTRTHNISIPAVEAKVEAATFCCNDAVVYHAAAWSAEIVPVAQEPGLATVECSFFDTVPPRTEPKANASAGVTHAPAGGSAVPLYPSWPASSPWVTAVGATRPLNDVFYGAEVRVGVFAM